jgi:hypothetical protein
MKSTINPILLNKMSPGRVAALLQQITIRATRVAVVAGIMVALTSVLDRFLGFGVAAIWGFLLIPVSFERFNARFRLVFRAPQNYLILLGACAVTILISASTYAIIGLIVDAFGWAGLRQFYWRGFGSVFEAFWRIGAACAWGVLLPIVAMLIQRLFTRRL